MKAKTNQEKKTHPGKTKVGRFAKSVTLTGGRFAGSYDATLRSALRVDRASEPAAPRRGRCSGLTVSAAHEVPIFYFNRFVLLSQWPARFALKVSFRAFC